MTYNIRNSNAADGPNKWKFRKEKVVTLIKNVNPDVLGTQEVLFDQYKDLQHMLTDYSVFGVGRNNGKHAGEHSCIFYTTCVKAVNIHFSHYFQQYERCISWQDYC